VFRACPRGRAVYGIGLPPLAGWDCGFSSRREGGGDVSLSECFVLSDRDFASG